MPHFDPSPKQAKNSSASGRKLNQKQKKILLIACAVLFVLAVVFYLKDPDAFMRALEGFAETAYSDTTPQPGTSPQQGTAQPETPSPAQTPIPGAALEIYVLDVGQGDSIFLRSPKGKTMLVDASESKHFAAIDSFLQEQGVEKLDVVVATHPHSDHIGGMSKVIDAYKIGKFYMPAITHTTSTFEKMLDSLEKRGVTPQVVYASKSAKIAWGDGSVTARILSPFEGVDYDMNNWSIVLHIQYGETSILLTADAEAPAENVMLANLPAQYLSATVLKLGHHGSSTSTSDAFLAAVAPEIALASVGANNDYGHPHQETLDRLAQNDIAFYRTDEQGIIKIVLDGTTATVTVEKD